MRVPFSTAMVLVLSACAAPAPADHAAEAPTALAWPADPAAAQLTEADLTAVPGCAERTPVLTSDSLGLLRPRRTLAELEMLCPSAQLVWDWGDEAVPFPAALMRLGQATVSALLGDTLRSSRVLELTIHDKHARTREGFGIGSSFGELQDAYGSPVLREGECAIDAVFAREPSLVWSLEMPQGTLGCERIPQVVERNAVDEVPEQSLIRSVRLVFGLGAA